MPFLDIFSKTREKLKKNINKKVIIDFREKNSLVPSELSSLGIDIEFQDLKVGDYLINNIAIERKTAQDFISSMINKRLFSQLEEMKQYKESFLIIEGNPLKTEFKNKNALRGFMLSILTSFKIPILYSKDEKETATYLSILSNKQEKTEKSIRPSKLIFSKKEQLQYILEGFPNIGAKTSIKLLKKFKTLNKIFSSSKEDLEKEIGKKSESFDLLDEEY